MNHKAKQSDIFAEKLKKFPKKTQDLILEKIKKLEANPGYPSLRTKRIRGYDDLFESSINMNIRIFWQYERERILLFDIGYHDILKRY